jgi:hypothetical protein
MRDRQTSLWVPDIRFTSCDLRVLMDQPTEPIPSRNPSAWQDDMWFGGPERWRLPQGAVRAVAVVMIGILGQHRPQLPAPEDEHPVQHLPPNGTNPPLRIGIRPRRSTPLSRHPRGADDPAGQVMLERTPVPVRYGSRSILAAMMKSLRDKPLTV